MSFTRIFLLLLFVLAVSSYESMKVTPDQYSWNGKFKPTFPIEGLFDSKYNSETDTPLPPGDWDWEDSSLANWRNFKDNLGNFTELFDENGDQFGWKLVTHETNADWDALGSYWEGSAGLNLAGLGPEGKIHSTGDTAFGSGPTVLSFLDAWSLDARTSTNDDLVLIGYCNNLDDPSKRSPDGKFHFQTATIHTLSGNDRVYVRDIGRAAIDLGNGNSGRTDTIDENDGDDIVAIHGNSYDFRMFGGNGNDVFFWYVDENNQEENWLGPNFFGSGGWGDALWGGDGTDRLVMVIPTDTTIVNGTGYTSKGTFRFVKVDGEFSSDQPTESDLYARYCVTCGTHEGDNRKTAIFEYRSEDESVFTAWFYVTNIEELQIGIGENAKVYEVYFFVV
ncbi:hypothetical protein M0813_14237 [Anaeramoeba flamelloides]|uniref:Calcium-binding protein n=1 Tax=Anaeramoeba flamelloides TaxID=1746091 RepID=A0ABQ8Z6P2_9EUKA|nr:hypothetical protein M0813_14237 [Anaeramoeba flamelloides]